MEILSMVIFDNSWMDELNVKWDAILLTDSRTKLCIRCNS